MVLRAKQIVQSGSGPDHSEDQTIIQDRAEQHFKTQARKKN